MVGGAAEVDFAIVAVLLRGRCGELSSLRKVVDIDSGGLGATVGGLEDGDIVEGATIGGAIAGEADERFDVGERLHVDWTRTGGGDRRRRAAAVGLEDGSRLGVQSRQ